MFGGRFAVEARFIAKDRVSAPVTRMQNKVGKATRSMGRKFDALNRKINKFGRGLRKAGMVASIVGVAAVGAFTNIAKAGIGFEQAITNVGAVGLKTRAQIQPLEKLARELGENTVFTATQSANAMEVLTRSGFSMNQTMKTTPAVLAAASAGQMGIAETANIVTKALKGMGLDEMKDIGEQATRVADAMAFASTKTNTTMGSIGESLSKVASVARTVKIPLEDTVASVALLQDLGLDPAVAGTAFKTMISKMAKPMGDTRKALDEMGISFEDAKGNMKAFPQLMEELSKGATGVGGNFKRMAFLIDLVGMRGQLAANDLVKLSESGRLADLTAQLYDIRGKGVVDRMAKLRLKSVAGDLTKLASAVDSVKISMFGATSSEFGAMIKEMTAWVKEHRDEIAKTVGDFIANIFKNRRQIIDSIASWWEVIQVVLAAVVVFKIFAGVLSLVNLIMIANPIGLIITAVVLLVGWIAFLIVKAGGFKAAWKNVTDWFAGAWSHVADGFTEAWRRITRGWEKFVNMVKGSPVVQILGSLNNIGKIGAGFANDLFGGAEQYSGTGRYVPYDPNFPSGEDSPVPGTFTTGDRVAHSMQENNSTAEVTLKDETGRAELTGGALGNGVNLLRSGGF